MSAAMIASKRPTYKVQNWSEYNRALQQRGSLTIWFSQEAIAQWHYEGEKQRGAQFEYSDLAIETMLTLKMVYHLPLRQTEGLVNSIAQLMSLDIAIPDYSTLSRRQKGLEVDIPVRRQGEGLHVVVDSTGLKVYGEGEWKVRQHGITKRRTWRKLHLAINEANGDILAAELTGNAVDDAAEVDALLSPIEDPIHAFGADGAYDKQKVYESLQQLSQEQQHPIDLLIPPRKDAVLSSPESPPAMAGRDANILAIQQTDRSTWKKTSGYHRRSLAETGVFRYKTIIGPVLTARNIERQKTEAMVGCSILNRMTALGMPVAIKAA